jgi:hypothetical protein
LVYLAAEGDDMEKTVSGCRFLIFGGHVQGLRLKESQYQLVVKIMKHNV